MLIVVIIIITYQFITRQLVPWILVNMAFMVPIGFHALIPEENLRI